MDIVQINLDKCICISKFIVYFYLNPISKKPSFCGGSERPNPWRLIGITWKQTIIYEYLLLSMDICGYQWKAMGYGDQYKSMTIYMLQGKQKLRQHKV